MGRSWLSSFRRVAALMVVAWSAAAAAVPAGACVGDCNEDGAVAINELVVGVNIALGSQPVTACQAFACGGDGEVPISCLIQGVNSALNGCSGPTITLAGACAAPGDAGLAPCAAGTPITVFRCDDRRLCLQQQGLTMIGAASVGNAGAWSVEVPSPAAGALLIVQAGISGPVVYRALMLDLAGSLRAALAGGTPDAATVIGPVSEAAVRLLDSHGFENYADAAVARVIAAVEQATAALSFAGAAADAAVTQALEVASADPAVVTALQGPEDTPTATSAADTPTLAPTTAVPTSTAAPTGTATAMPTVAPATATVTFTAAPTGTATAVPTVAPTTAGPTFTASPTRTATTMPTPTVRYVDHGDGSITDQRTGLTWEKKDRAGGLHDVDAVYFWAGLCSDGSAYCQPNAAAAAACAAVPGVTAGCALCAGSATCDTSSRMTIWEWVSQLNVAGFAGHDDWRIPTVHDDGGTAELETIRERGSNPCGQFVPCVPAAFNTSCAAGCAVDSCSCADPGYHWTASFPTNQLYSTFYDFESGTAGYAFKWNTFGSLYPVRAVRGTRTGN
jgi:hypothetical protein